MLRSLLLILLISLTLVASPGSRVRADEDNQDLVGGFEALRQQDVRTTRISFALRRANRDVCPRTGPLLGWTLHNAAQYSPRVRAQAQRHFRLLADYPAVLALAPDGPAARAGLLPNDAILAINDIGLGRESVEAKPSFQSLGAALDVLTRELARPGVLLIERNGTRREIAISADVGCAYETQLDLSPDLQASADAGRVFLTSSLAAFANDDELAVILGHEYAHILLGHPPDPLALKPAAAGPMRQRTRDEEIAADRLGLRLAQKAGFDISAGPRLLGRLGRAKPWLKILLWRREIEMRREVERLK